MRMMRFGAVRRSRYAAEQPAKRVTSKPRWPRTGVGGWGTLRRGVGGSLRTCSGRRTKRSSACRCIRNYRQAVPRAGRGRGHRLPGAQYEPIQTACLRVWPLVSSQLHRGQTPNGGIWNGPLDVQVFTVPYKVRLRKHLLDLSN
ncbi:hypothetical protein SKAU_G00239040 [Synaphobranchus kaupii]|uniref:Uncharacterized protein n=1 Tax=Synaphobranchus kaupii TaxID=118154 RepID=A0A9Q1F7A1_SYNKA|nr:hypothetical protein SKAU_G00239040 [Synaphobranchus kaupii]